MKNKASANQQFLERAVQFVKTNQRLFTCRDFVDLYGYSQDNFNQLVHRIGDDIIMVGNGKYIPTRLLKSINSLDTSHSDKTEHEFCQTPSLCNDNDLLLWFLGQNIHNIRSNYKNVKGIYNRLKLNYEPESSALHEIKLPPDIINNMDVEISAYTNDTVKIIIGCSSNPILLNHADIDKLINTYHEIRESLLLYTPNVPPLDQMRITQFDYAIDAVYYKVGNFNTYGMEFPTFIKALAKVYYPEKNKMRLEQPNVSNIDWNIDQLKAFVDKILPFNFNNIAV